VAEELRFTTLDRGRLSIRSVRGVENLVLEALHPDGEVRTSVVDLLPGEAQTFEARALGARRDEF
jgi:hypothetical protein